MTDHIRCVGSASNAFPAPCPISPSIQATAVHPGPIFFSSVFTKAAYSPLGMGGVLQHCVNVVCPVVAADLMCCLTTRVEHPAARH